MTHHVLLCGGLPPLEPLRELPRMVTAGAEAKMGTIVPISAMPEFAA